MTKAGIINALNSFINAGGKVTKTRHTNANEVLVDELFPTQTSVTGTYNGFFHELKFKKIGGNNVQVKGTFTNTSPSLVGFGAELFVISDAELQHKTGDSSFISGLNNSSIIVSENKIFANSNIGSGQVININGIYTTND